MIPDRLAAGHLTLTQETEVRILVWELNMAIQRFSSALLKYLFYERDWLRSGRPDELSDMLDHTWFRLSTEDRLYCNSRGTLQADDETWIGGNNYSHDMLDALEAQVARPENE